MTISGMVLQPRIAIGRITKCLGMKNANANLTERRGRNKFIFKCPSTELEESIVMHLRVIGRIDGEIDTTVTCQPTVAL